MLAASRKSTCTACEKELTADEKTIYKSKVHCLECTTRLFEEEKVRKAELRLEKKLEQKQTKTRKKHEFKLEDKKQTPEDPAYISLITCICDYFKIKEPTPLIIKQIKESNIQYKHLYGGIQYCFNYVTSVANKTLELKYGIALLQYYYDSAEEYWYQQQRIAESVNNIELIEPKVNIVKINLNKIYEKKNKFLIDLDQFFDDKEGD